MTKVVNLMDEPYDVYIGSPSKWANPFAIGKNGSRKEVIEKYKRWLLSQPELLIRLPELKGKVLGCLCKPKACHGDILVRLINAGRF
jgi:hypothetical protein